MRLAPVLLVMAACASSQSAGGSGGSDPETLRSTGAFIRACLARPFWAQQWSAARAGAKPKVRLAALEDRVGGIDTNAMLAAMERAMIDEGSADVLPWGDALAGMASYQADAMALGGGESSVAADPNFIVGGTIDRIAAGGTHTELRLVDSEGNPVCGGAKSAQ